MGAFRALERSWQTALKAGDDVEVTITARYVGGSTRPSAYIVEWTVDGQPFRRVFRNAPGGR